MTTTEHTGQRPHHVDLAVADLTTALARRSRAAHDAAIGQLVALGFDREDVASMETRISKLFTSCADRRRCA